MLLPVFSVISSASPNERRAPHTHTHVHDTIYIQVVYKRYASLFFIAVVDLADNELITLEVRGVGWGWGVGSIIHVDLFARCVWIGSAWPMVVGGVIAMRPPGSLSVWYAYCSVLSKNPT